MAELTTTMIAARLAFCGIASLVAGAAGHPANDRPTLEQFRVVEVLSPHPKDAVAQKNLATEALVTIRYVQQYNGTSLKPQEAIDAVIAAARTLELGEWSGKDCPTYDRLLPNPEQP